MCCIEIYHTQYHYFEKKTRNNIKECLNNLFIEYTYWKLSELRIMYNGNVMQTLGTENWLEQ